MPKKPKHSLDAFSLSLAGTRTISSFAMAPAIDRNLLHVDRPDQAIATLGKKWRLRVLRRAKVS